MDSWKRFNELMPSEEDSYYSKLNKKGITKEDIKHVKNVCDTFKIKTASIMIYMFNRILHYLLMYLKTLEINA